MPRTSLPAGRASTPARGGGVKLGAPVLSLAAQAAAPLHGRFWELPALPAPVSGSGLGSQSAGARPGRRRRDSQRDHWLLPELVPSPAMAQSRLPSPAQQMETDDRTALVRKPITKGGNSDLPSAGFNVINSIIGSGIIGLPYSMKQAGFPLGVLLLVGVAFITDYSIILLIKGGNLSGTNTYQALVNKSYGFMGYLILSTLQFLYPFIAMISYNIITGDTLTKVFQTIPGVGLDNLLTYRQVIILCTTIIFTLPMSLYRDIAKLAKISFISLILTTVILVIVMIRTATLGPLVPKTENAWVFAKSNAIQAIGVMSFAFVCHHNSFLIYGSLEEPTLSNWSRITHVSVSLALFISVVFAACGYVTFTGYTEGDIFENYCRDDNLATFGRFCYGITIILTFPIECFVTREVRHLFRFPCF